MNASKQKDISIAIITRNRHRSLKRCLLSLTRQTVYPKEVLIIDNASKDRTKDLASSFKEVLPIRYIYETSVGIPYARNRALKEARGEILAFIDDDCEATPNWIEEMVKAHKKYPEAVAVQGEGIIKPNNLFTYTKNKIYALWIMQNLRKSHLTIIDTKNVSFKIALVKQNKIMFDGRFQRGSDVDFAKQILSKGLEIIYHFPALTYHWETNIIIAITKDYAKGQGTAKLRHKWPDEYIRSVKEGIKYHESIKSIESELPFLKRVMVMLLIKAHQIIFNRGLSYQYNTNILKISPVKKTYDEISIAIITRNRYHRLKKCLFSLSKQAVYPKEVIIIDNASKDRTKDLVNLFRKVLPLRYFHESKIGKHYARNRALKEAQGEILAFIDDDCEATPNWIEEMVKAHKKHPEAMAIQGKCFILPEKGFLTFLVQQEYSEWVNKHLKINKLTILDTANVSFKKNLLAKYGLSFDSSLKNYPYTDDVDFAKQIISKKQAIVYYPQAEVGSWRRNSLLIYLKQRYLKGQSKALIRYKWGREFTDSITSVNQPNRSSIFINTLISLSKTIFNLGEDIEKIKILYASFNSELKPKNRKINQKNLSLAIRALLGFKRKVNYFNILFLSIVLRFIYKELTDEDLRYKKLTLSSTKNESKMSNVSVIVKAGDDVAKLCASLSSLINQSILPKKAIILIDDSVKYSDIFFCFFDSPFPIYAISTTNSDTGKGLKETVEKSTGEILAFTDDNSRPARNWIEETIKSHRAHPEATAVQGCINFNPWASLFSTVNRVLFKMQLKHNLFMDNSLSFIDAKNVSFKKNAFNHFNLNFYSLSGQASFIDLAWQIVENKQKILYAPEIAINHYPSNIISFFKEAFDLGLSYAKIHYKWCGSIQKRPFYKLLIEHEQSLSNINARFTPSFWRIPRGIVLGLIYKTYQKCFLMGFTSINKNIVIERLIRSKLNKPQNSNISIAIITRHRDFILNNVLLSLTRQTVYPKEVLIIDNASKDRTKDLASSFKEVLPIRYIYETSVGIPYARNRALKEARGEILAFIDDDCEATPNWIEEMVKAHKKYPEAVAVQGISYCKNFNVYSLLSQKYHHDWLKKNLKEDNKIMIIDTKNVSLKKDRLINSGCIFDIDFDRGSDADIAKQLLAKGESIFYENSIRVYFKPRSGLISFMKQRYIIGFFNARLKFKWPNDFDLKSKTKINNELPAENGAADIGQINHLIFLLARYLSRQIYRFGFLWSSLCLYYNFKYLDEIKPVFNQDLRRNNSFKGRKLKLSIMIITKDRYASLARTLRSLINQTVKPDQIIIVDSSVNRNTSFIKDFKMIPITYIYEKRLGFGLARNIAIKHSIGDLITTLDDDEETVSDWCEKILEAHEKNPDIAAIQGRLLSRPTNSVYAIIEQLRLDRWFLNKLDYFGHLYAISTKNFSFKKKIIENYKLKLKTDKLYGQLGDDVDFGYQILSSGLQVLYNPSIMIHHWERHTLGNYLQQQYRKGSSRALIKRDWGYFEKSIPRFFYHGSNKLDIFLHPLIRKNILLLPLIIPLYFISLYVYAQGLKRMMRKSNS